jgi:cytochrome c-type biogenesis protein
LNYKKPGGATFVPNAVTYAGAALAGLVSFASPCVLPLVPAYLSFLGGVGIEGSAERPSRARLFSVAAAFVFGFALVFVALGASATLAGRLLADHIVIFSRISGVLLVFLGLQYAGVINVRLLNRDARFHPIMRRGGIAAAVLIGAAFAFGWTPCVGPVLATVLLVAGRTASVWHGVTLLAAYAAGLGVPFLVAALALGSATSVLNALKRWARPIEVTMGGVMILTGVAIFAGTLSTASGWIMHAFPTLTNVG